MRLYNSNNIKIGEKLKRARLTSGLTQEEVAELIDSSQRYIGQLESNSSGGSISVMLNLCNIYHITLDDLYGDYLNIEVNEDNLTFGSYNTLKPEYKSIIDNNIGFLNKLQNSNV